MKQMTLVAALREFFGYRPGQSAGDFLQELRALTDKDKDDFKTMFPSVGITIVEKS